MTLFIVIAFFVFLFSYMLLRQHYKEKGIKRRLRENTYIVNDQIKVFSNEQVKKIKNTRYGTSSWYKKRPGKNKGL